MSVIDTDTDNMTSSSSGGGNGSKKTGLTGAAKKAADRKAARARTVLSEKQLNILKTCYSANPRPGVNINKLFFFVTDPAAK